MSRLLICSGRDAVRAFGRLGYVVDHQTGSHIILRHPGARRLVVPDHKELHRIFQTTKLADGEFPFFWSGTTHLDGPPERAGEAAV